VLAPDLSGVKRVIEGLSPLARRHTGWAPLLTIAHGHFDLLRGDLEGAHAAFQACLVGIAMVVADNLRPLPAQVTADLAAVARGLLEAKTCTGTRLAI